MTVQFNYHVELREDRHYYSVPWHLHTRDPRTKVKLKLLYDERTVSICYDNVRLVEYQRDRRRGVRPPARLLHPGTPQGTLQTTRSEQGYPPSGSLGSVQFSIAQNEQFSIADCR